MDKYGCFMQMYVYYYWNHSQHRARSVGYSCFKGHRCFSKNLFMSIRHIKKETPGSHYFFICTEQFTLFTFLHDRAALLLNTHTKIEKRMFKFQKNLLMHHCWIKYIIRAGKFKEKNLPALIMYFIQQWCIKLIKSNKGIYIISKFCILNTFSFELYIHQRKYIVVSTKILSSTTVFDNNNKKCFLSTKSAYYNDFWRIMRHWRLWCHIN